jgi:GTP cyclohydrolase I
VKDVQNQSDTRGVEIQKVGIKDFELPIVIQRKDAEDKVIYASATCGVTLPAHYKGTHMSRFVEVLNEWRGKKTLDIKNCVESMVEKLDAKSAYLKFDFKYFIDKKSPVTGISAPMCYDCTFEGMLDNWREDDEEYRFFLAVKVPVTTL